MHHVLWAALLINGHQYVPPGAGGRVAAVTDVELALDVNGGRDRCYLYGPPEPANNNHLWRVTPVGDAVMLVSRVDGMALDANGGRGNPYPRSADPTNLNHRWLLVRVGDDVMIWSKVTNVVLDANGGRGRPYLSTNPDPRNVNHLWSLRKVGDDVMIVSKVRRAVEPLKVGDVAPPVPALIPDGSPLLPEHLRGRTVLLSFWSMTDPGVGRHLDLLRGLRKEYLDGERFRMVSVCVDDAWPDWLAFLDKQKPLDAEFPLRSLGSDARWWQVMRWPAKAGEPDPYRVTATPRSFVIGPDGKLLAVNLSDENVRDAVAAAVKAAK